MVNITIVNNTASSFKFTLSHEVTFQIAKIWMRTSKSDDNELDSYDVKTNTSKTHIITINSAAGEIGVDLNRLPFESIYYKDFFMQFIDSDGNEVNRTSVFQISPYGKEALYGIVNKLSFDFEQLARFSGVTVRIFTQSLIESKCAKCWDFELDQPISSTCDCGGPKYTYVDVLGRRTKTQSKQEYDNTGSKINEQSVFQTYDRADFIKGTFFSDYSNKEIYEVVDRTIANIGGVRTSTLFIGKLVKSNDVRVAGLLNLLD